MFSVIESKGIITLRNDLNNSSISFCPERGCEICSLTYKGVELIHRANNFSEADENDWYGHGINLFPAVGRQQNGIYRHGDEVLHMPLHGFIMSAPFTVTLMEATDTYATLKTRLTPNIVGKEYYPFDYDLCISARISVEGISIDFEVLNNSSTEILPYGIGNHIAFAYPFSLAAENSAFEEGILDSTSTHKFEINSDSLFSGEVTPMPKLGDGLPLKTDGLLDAVFGCRSYDEMRLNSMSLSQPNGLKVSVSHSFHSSDLTSEELAGIRRNMHFVVWGSPPVNGNKKGFVCTEPWISGPNSLNTKKGLVQLRPLQSATWTMNVRVE